MRIDDTHNPVRLAFNIECARIGWQTENTEFFRQSTDYEQQVGYAAAQWFATLPERATLEIKRPATWLDYVLRGVKMKLEGTKNFSRIASLIDVAEDTSKYEAIHYFPAVEIPEKMRKGSFMVWWDKGTERAYPPPPYVPRDDDEDDEDY